MNKKVLKYLIHVTFYSKHKVIFNVSMAFKEKFQNIINKYPWMTYLNNRYVLISLGFAFWMLFLDNYSYWQHRELNKQIDELERRIYYFETEIKKDIEAIKLLKNPHEIEKYAREKYYMKRNNEDIFIIEFEGDPTE